MMQDDNEGWDGSKNGNNWGEELLAAGGINNGRVTSSGKYNNTFTITEQQ